MLPFSKIQKHVVDKLVKGLSPALTYHNVSHTLDVLEQAEAIAIAERITSEEDLMLIKISALYHDVGFIKVYGGHEEESCVLAIEELSSFGFRDQQLQKVTGMIRATKVPQIPQNKLEEIICDADLDYLGRDDFFTIGDGLYKEFLYQKIVTDEDSWNRLQVKFLESHHYFTETSKKRRQHEKQRHLEEVKAKLLTSIS
jgi:HD superfamily phosphodiesterase